MVADDKRNVNSWYILVACFITGIVLQFIAATSFENSTSINIPLHAVLEATGAILALVISYFLFSLKKLNWAPNRSDRIACALIGMGLLDGFHAVSPIGNTFVWLHSMAIFLGSLFFVFILLPDNIYNKFRKTWPLLSLLIVVFIGAYSFLLPQNIPAMLFGNSFSSIAVLLNIGGGVLFYLTATYFFCMWRRTKNVDSVLFLLFCILIGTSAIMFQQSKFWDASWWTWHLVKVIAYMSILCFVFLSQTRLISDIKESKRKQEVFSLELEIGLAKVTESERKYRNIFENVQDVFYQTSLEGITLNVSPSIKQHLGFTPEEVIGTSVANIYYDPRDREEGLTILKEKGELKDYEIRFRSKSGGLVYVSLNTLLIRDEHGNPSHLDGSYKNITDRKKAEFELEATLLQLENRVIERTKELSDKNKDILDSITYAKRIQEAKLPKKEEIYYSLPHSFVLFKPKDIVSGDFYFFHKNNNRKIFIAAADCTGHGVPGALMSMLGSEKLNDAVGQSTDPSEILKLLNKGIRTSLRQSNEIESTRDGMDIALCHVDIEHRIIKFAGANRPFWIIRKDKFEVEELKPTKKALGGLTDDQQSFQSHEIQLQKGDTFYLTTDGFADTFGGPHKKKLMTKKFKQILLDIQDKEMSEQEKYLDDFIESWKSGIEQVDDILVIGVRL